MQKLDIYHHKQRYENWKEKVKEEGEEGMTKQNSDILLKFIFDMEQGVNVNGGRKGARAPARLNNLRQRLAQIFRLLEERKAGKIAVTTIKDLQVLEKKVSQLFKDMRDGTLKTQKGKVYRSTGDYVRIFKSFWHWYQKVNRKKGKIILDITTDLDNSDIERHFVYITKEDFMDKYLTHFDEDEQTFLLFAFDSLMRFPSEILSVKVSNIYQEDGEVWVHVPAEIAKTKRDRDFNLLLSGKEILDYIERKKLQQDDYLFKLSPPVLIDKMQKVAKQIWGEAVSHQKAGEKYCKITPYDLRHSGAIFLRKKAKENPAHISLDAIRERGGWTDFKMLDYYTKFIGLDGKIEKRGLLTKKEVSEMEARLEQLEKALTHIPELLVKYAQEGKIRIHKDAVQEFEEVYTKAMKG